jgi:hypothetical protein
MFPGSIHHPVLSKPLSCFYLKIWGLSKKYPTLFLPTVSNDKRVGKLSIMVVGTFMRMHDFLLPCYTTGYICRCHITKWCNTCSSHSHFAQDDRTLGAVILHGYDPETKVQSSQWKHQTSLKPKEARQVQSNVKVILTFSRITGVLFIMSMNH